MKRGTKKLETFITCWDIGRDVKDILRHLGRHLGSLGCLKRWPLSIVSQYIQSKVSCKLQWIISTTLVTVFYSLLHKNFSFIYCHIKRLMYGKITYEIFQQWKNHNKIMNG